MSFIDRLWQKLSGEPPLHPIDQQMAKRWVKERLKRMYPELKDDPRALEKTYQSLNLEARPGAGKGGAAMYEVILPGRLD